ncbi:cytosine permease [Orbus mooreae]
MTEKLDSITIKTNRTLFPKNNSERTIPPFTYICMWIADGVNLGNMTLGASLFVAGIATINLLQTTVAALIAISIISIIFVLNDRFGYRTGAPYVIQLRMSFGIKGSIVSSLMRGIPAIVWYGFQSWIGGTALNEIVKIATHGSFDNIFVCFLILQVIQIILSLYGFHSIKWVETLISIVIMVALIYVFIILLTQYSDVVSQNWLHTEGTWGIKFGDLSWFLWAIMQQFS